MVTEDELDIAAGLARAGLLHQEGRLEEAAPLYQRVLAADPAHFDAHHIR